MFRHAPASEPRNIQFEYVPVRSRLPGLEFVLHVLVMEGWSSVRDNNLSARFS